MKSSKYKVMASHMDENATRVIAQYESMTVKNDVFDSFTNACREARKPNKALEDATAFTKKQGIYP